MDRDDAALYLLDFPVHDDADDRQTKCEKPYWICADRVLYFYGASAVPWHRHRGGDDRGRYAAGKEEHADTDCLFPAGSPVQQLCAFDHQGQAAK